jgi:hypothetical protein
MVVTSIGAGRSRDHEETAIILRNPSVQVETSRVTLRNRGE